MRERERERQRERERKRGRRETIERDRYGRKNDDEKNVR